MKVTIKATPGGTWVEGDIGPIILDQEPPDPYIEIEIAGTGSNTPASISFDASDLAAIVERARSSKTREIREAVQRP